MADGFIVRKGGVTTEQALAPTILNISENGDSISFEIKNNDTETAVILFEIDDTTPDENSIELAGGATSSTLTIAGLDLLETYIIFATANVTGKVKSEVASQSITTSGPIFTAATGGTTLEYDTGGKRFRSHTFTSNGNFVVSTAGNGDRSQADYLIIAGGGAGGNGGDGIRSGGGGGAGGYRTTLGTSGQTSPPESKVTLTNSTFAIEIGGGGTGVVGQFANPSSGANSVAFGQTSIGGGRGGSGSSGTLTGVAGGSGGGGGNFGNNSGGVGTFAQGNNGGNSTNIQSGIYPAGGGGGAGSVGENTTNADVVPNGGVGLSNILRTGSSEIRGVGGGTTGPSQTAGQNATVNTGNGGQGSSGNSAKSGNGGSGIVVIRYEIATV